MRRDGYATIDRVGWELVDFTDHPIRGHTFFEIMSQDPFERFERSRGGLLIPVVVFILGAVPTAIAIRAMSHLAVLEDDPVEAAPAPDGEVEEATIIEAIPDIGTDNEEPAPL